MGFFLLPSVLGPFASGHTPLLWSAVVVGASLLGAAIFARTGWRSAAAWIALLLAGQACAFQLLWAGNQVRLQLFYGWQILLRSYQGLFLAAVAVQAIIVLWGVIRMRDSLKDFVPKVITSRQAALFVALFAFAAVTIHPEVARALVRGRFAGQLLLYLSKVALGVVVFGVAGMNLLLAAISIPAENWERLRSRWSSRLRSPLIPWICATWVVFVAALLSWFALDRMPHVPDEVGFIVEAKYLAAGHLYLPQFAVPQAVHIPFQFADAGRWYNSLSAGWPFVLALGFLLRIPWLVNPVLGGISILLAHRFVRKLYDQETANGVALLLALSPWLLFLSASYMAHALSLACALLALIAVQECRESGSILWAALAGLAIGALLHVRSLEAVVIALVCGTWWLAVGWRRLRLPAVAAACIVALAMTGLFLEYNKILTGDSLQVPFNKFADVTFYKGSNRLGFGHDIGNWGWTGLDPLPGHGPIDVVMNTSQNLYLLNFETFGWACGSLVFVLLLLVWRPRRDDWLMWGFLFATWAAMSLYWFSGGPDFGARYWYLMILPVAVLTIRGARFLAVRLGNAGGRVWAFVAVATIAGSVNLVLWRSVDKYPNYRGLRADIGRLERQYQFGRSLVFVRGRDWPDYASAVPFEPPTFDDNQTGPIFVQDAGPEFNGRVQALYPDRAVWIVDGPTVTGAGFKVAARPISAAKTTRAGGSATP